MSEYQEFTGKTVEEALREARDAFGAAGLDELDFEILTPGSRGVLGMGAEPARIIAAPRSALGGAAPRRDAAAQTPLPPPPPRESFGDRPERSDRSDRPARREGGFSRDRGGRPDRGPRREGGYRSERPAAPTGEAPLGEALLGEAPVGEAPLGEAPAGESRGGYRDRPAGRRPDRTDRGPRREGGFAGRERSSGTLSASEQEEVRAGRASLSVEREEIQAAEASPEALEAGREILAQLLGHMGLSVSVSVETGDTSKLDVRGDEQSKEALGALIGRKGERLSALQHLVNLMLSRKLGAWTRVLVDVEDYRGRRERQLREIATRAAEKVKESGKMLQLEPMPALERRWIHLALRGDNDVATQSIGEEPHRRVVILRRQTGG
ncbi:MAG: spoIIIJ-associated protein [Chloroflexota bacterium]|jgi:spoIIIJ-associated protein|nr:spoIIIJ-associated protein [Chloroflexota bacterium]